MLSGMVSEEPGSLEEIPDHSSKCFGVYTREVPMHHHHQIEPLNHLAPVQANILAKPSLYPVPGNRTAKSTRDGQA